MNHRSFHSYWCLVLLVWKTLGAEETPRLAATEVQGPRPFLRYERPTYRNFAFDPFTHYADHTWGQREPGRAVRLDMSEISRQKALWGPLGDYLATGYDLFTWIERRQPEQRRGSELFKDWPSWSGEFNNVVVARDGYGGWGYNAIVGDGLIARLSPLTLSKTDLNGLRMDVSLPRVKFTGVGSRIARPNRESSFSSENAMEVAVGPSTLLVGGRAQADLGALHLGLNGVNLHSYNSTEPDNSIKGQLRPDQPFYSWLIVRISDDAPADGRGGATVQEVQLILNGEVRPDLQAQVLRQQSGFSPQVGRTLRSGEFLPTNYNSIRDPSSYYRGREIPPFADYLYRLAYKAREDVSGNTDLERLLASLALEAPAEILRADGDEQLIYLFDLGQEPYVESAEVEAVVGNDYRVEWAGVYSIEQSAPKFENRFRSTFYRTVRRARGSVSDGSNLKRVRFEVGENTALFTYSADVHLALPWLEVSGEYARSAVYGRYPARLEEQSLFDESPRFARRGSAYFINALHGFERGGVGVEYFSMNPDFVTEMETYLPKDFGYQASRGRSPFHGLANETVIWRLVQDNEDGDRWPDVGAGNVLGSPTVYNYRAVRARDGDGVFPGQDEDNDGLVDTDRNFNGTPDYEEIFLMYEVEPNEYVYGLDRNHNDEPDRREDDWEPDYPYDVDQRGHHLFGRVDLSRHWSLGAGRYAIDGLASGGRNRSLYALLSYRKEGIARLRRLFFENHFRRVHDDIPDEFNEFSRAIRLVTVDLPTSRGSGVVTDVVADIRPHPDLLFYQNSYVNESYLEGRLQPWSTLNLSQQLRLRFNWQQGGRLASERFQRARRLDFWGVVSRVDYTWHWGKLRVVPQFKYLYLRLRDREADRDLRFEDQVIPILKVAHPLMSRTMLQAGVQGWGPVPYRLKNRTQKRESFERRSTFFNLTNSSRYFGYDLYTIIGFNRDELDFDDPLQRFREIDRWSFFVRGLVGFTEFGRPL